MPLNMNTVGTGTGIDSGSGGSDSTMILKPSEILDTYSDVYPSYYVTNDQLPTTRTLTTCQSFNAYSQCMFIFKNEIYAVTMMNTYINSSYSGASNHNMAAVLNKVSYSGPALTYTQLFTFKVYNEYFDDGSYNYGVDNYLLESRALAIPSTDYIYFSAYEQIKTTNPSNGNVTVTYENTLYRFDGTTAEKMLIPDLPTVYNAYTFTQLDHKCTRLLVGYESSKNVYIIDLQKYSVVSGKLPTYMATPVKGYYDSTTARTYGIRIMDNMGYFVWGYRDSSGNIHKVKSTCEVTENQNHSFTLSNISINSYSSSYWNGSSYSLSECGVITFITTSYDKWNSPSMFVYNPETAISTCYDLSGSPSGDIDNNRYAGGVRRYSIIDRMSKNIMYISTYSNPGRDNNYGTYNSYFTTHVQYEPINDITYITNKSDNPESALHGYFKKGDIVYCSSKITEYKLSDASSYTTYAASRVFKVPSDGNYDIRSNHQIREYRSTWIVESVSGGFSFITVNKVSDTQISGYFIKDMLVNGTKITSDGKQELTFEDLNKTGVYISMKGVK